MKDQTKQLKDIATNLEHTRELLHVSEDKYRQLVENADCIILRISKEGKITFFNEFAQKFFGYIERQILGKNIIGTIIPAKDRSGRNIEKLIRDIKRHPELYTSYENESICKNGRRVWIAWANKAIYDAVSYTHLRAHET